MTTRTLFLLTSATKLLGNYKSHFHAMCKEDFKVVLSRNYVIVDVSFISITWHNLQAFNFISRPGALVLYNLEYNLGYVIEFSASIEIIIITYIVYVMENISRRSCLRNESMKNMINFSVQLDPAMPYSLVRYPTMMDFKKIINSNLTKKLTHFQLNIEW